MDTDPRDARSPAPTVGPQTATDADGVRPVDAPDGATAVLEERPTADLDPDLSPAAMAQRIESALTNTPAEPADAAHDMAGLDAAQAAAVATAMPAATAATVIAEMDAQRAADIVAELDPQAAAAVLGELDPDDRVDILGLCDADLHDDLVARLDPADAEAVRNLEQYEPDTAGGIMTTEVTSLYEGLTVRDAIETLRRLADEVEQMFYVYVVDRRGHLVGVLSMRDLILARPARPIRDIMIEGVRSVRADADQEEVAQMMRKYHYLAMPVVDGQNKLIGIITIDDVAEVLEEEATEDAQIMFGAGAEERLTSPWTLSVSKRTGWLVVNLATAFLAGSVVGAFDTTISRMPVLAVFMPIVAGMGGNASAQAMSVSIRGLSVGKVDRRVLGTVLYREAIVGVLTGLLIGAITAGAAFFYGGALPTLTAKLAFGGVVAAALIINHVMACTTGAAIPFVMKSLGFDPAQSATIFATTVTDVVGFFSLLGLAGLVMGRIAA